MSAKVYSFLFLKLVSEDYVPVVTWLCLPRLMSHCVEVAYRITFVCQHSGFGLVLRALLPWIVSRKRDLFTLFIRT